jgi:hypothetical protein
MFSSENLWAVLTPQSCRIVRAAATWIQTHSTANVFLAAASYRHSAAAPKPAAIGRQSVATSCKIPESQNRIDAL